MKERLIELITKSDILCDTCGENSPSYCAEALAEHLLANGVVVDTNKVSAKNLPLITHIAGYPINEVIDLIEAKNTGRIVELPCAVGDTVYMFDEQYKEIGKADIYEGEIISFSFQNDGLWFYCRYKCGLTYWHKIEDFGKIVFTEKALERSEGK